MKLSNFFIGFVLGIVLTSVGFALLFFQWQERPNWIQLVGLGLGVYVIASAICDRDKPRRRRVVGVIGQGDYARPITVADPKKA